MLIPKILHESFFNSFSSSSPKRYNALSFDEKEIYFQSKGIFNLASLIPNSFHYGG